MVHTYQITGMTCSSCEAKVKNNLLLMPNVTDVLVSKENNTATITMEKHISLTSLQDALGGINSKYQITALQHSEVVEQTKSWLATYKPVLLIFAYITVISTLITANSSNASAMVFMNSFMAGFFLIFSFFKLLNLQGFVDSYAMYDVVAKRFKAWGFIYAFIELGLGLCFLINFQPLDTNIATLIIMSISIVGVLQSLFNKQKIQCACLGAVFNLPMSTITIIEDALMIAMSAIMIYLMI